MPQYQNEVKHKTTNFNSTRYKLNISENVGEIFGCLMRHSLLPPAAHCSDFVKQSGHSEMTIFEQKKRVQYNFPNYRISKAFSGFISTEIVSEFILMDSKALPNLTCTFTVS